jgi:hypothetical protein
MQNRENMIRDTIKPFKLRAPLQGMLPGLESLLRREETSQSGAPQPPRVGRQQDGAPRVENRTLRPLENLLFIREKVGLGLRVSILGPAGPQGT